MTALPRVYSAFLHPFLVAAFGRSRKKLAISGWPLLAALVVKGLINIVPGFETFPSQRRINVFFVQKVFLAWFFVNFLLFLSHFYTFWHPSMNLQQFWISPCRKWHLWGTYLKIFQRGACPQTPLEACAFGACGSGYAAPKTFPFSVDRVWISVTIVIYFSWDDCNTQEKLESMVIQNFGG